MKSPNTQHMDTYHTSSLYPRHGETWYSRRRKRQKQTHMHKTTAVTITKKRPLSDQLPSSLVSGSTGALYLSILCSFVSSRFSALSCWKQEQEAGSSHTASRLLLHLIYNGGITITITVFVVGRRWLSWTSWEESSR
jgi:hypothetical protein